MSATTGWNDVVTLARTLNSRSHLLLAGALAAFFSYFLAQDHTSRLFAMIFGLSLSALIGVLWAIVILSAWARKRLIAQVAAIVGQDESPCFATDPQGQILFQNASAIRRFGADSKTLTAALGDHFASPAAVLFRLQSRAARGASAREDVATRRGHSRLSVHQVTPDRFLWRLEEFVERNATGRSGAELLSLPMLVANKAGVILFSNEALRRLVGGRPRHLDRVFTTTALHSGEEVEVQGIMGPTRCLFAELNGAGERREIYLLPVMAQPLMAAVSDEFEESPVAMARFAKDGSVQVANQAARDLMGLPLGSEMQIHEIYEGLGRPILDWVSDIIDERATSTSEVLKLRKEGGEDYHQLNLRRVVQHGRPGVLAVIQDATQLKRQEAQIVQSQKMHAIGQLAGGIAHDFNNLLTAISGYCDLLLFRQDKDSPDYADLVQIHHNANRAAALVSQLLAFSRKQTMKAERIDIHDVLSDMTHLLNRLVGERTNLRLVHGAELGPIRADRRQLEQVLMNLVVNARDAMVDGGTILIETEALHLVEELRRNRAIVPPGDYAVIRVRDSGVGIPPDLLDTIFEPFFTTKRAGEGTGLGLSTVYGIVKQSGGFVFVDSTVGEGTVFQLYFPVHHGQDEGPRVKEPMKKKLLLRQGQGVVLLVEDEAPVRAFASRALRMRGYTVLEAEDAEKALEILENDKLDVDVFVTDVVMPGMDGPSWVKRALVERPNVRVIFVSGYAEDCLTEEQGRIPNSVFLPKPFSLSELAETVQGQMTQ